MKNRLGIAAALAISASMLLTACGGGSADEGDGESGQSITFLSWTGEEQMTPIIAAFNEEHPDIEVEVSYAPPVAEYIQTLQTRVLSGTAPDVFVIAAENKTNLIDAKQVLDLSGEPFMENVEQFNIDTYGRDGAAYGLSVSSWAAGFIYNEALLAEVGYDSVPDTWDEFLEMCKELDAAGIKPFMESVDQMPTTVSAWVGEKSSSMDPALDEQIFSGESTFEEQWTPFLEEYNRLYTEGIVGQEVLGLDGDMIRDEFIAGRVAMINGGPWLINAIREGAPDLEFKFDLVPGALGGAPFAAGAASPGYAINSQASDEAKEAAKTFLGFLASPAGVEIFHEQTNDVTVTSDFEPTVDPAFEPMAESIRSGQLYLPMISWQRSEDVLNVEAVAQIQRMIQGQIEPADVARAMDTKLAAS